MGWKSGTAGKWITENLGLTLAASIHKKTQIHILDDQRSLLPTSIEKMISKYPKVKDYASGIAIHWYMDAFFPPSKLDETRKLYPDLYLLMTEACIRQGTNDNAKVKLGSWHRGETYIVKMFENINHGLSGWVDWNLVRDKKGGPNWVNNNVDAPVIVNAEKDEFYKQPLYYAMTYFSRFVPPESVRLNLT